MQNIQGIKEKFAGQAWHHLSESEVVDILRTDTKNGLSSQDAAERLEAFGANVLSAKKSKNPWIMFLLQFHQPLIYILIASGVVTLWLKEYVDSGVIFGVVFLNAVIGFV